MQKGFAPVLVLVGILVLLTVAGGVYFLGKSQPAKPQNSLVSQTSQPTSQPTISPSSSPDITVNWKTYKNAQPGIIFKYPTNGNIQNSTDKNNVIYINNDSIEPYYLLSLEIRDNQQNLTPRQIIDNELAVLRKSDFPGSNSLADKRQATIKNYQNKEINGLYMRGGSDGDSVTDFIEIVIERGQNIYEFTIHDGNGSVDEFQKQLMDQILSTFKFTP